jgi:hypothetical protein
VLGGRVRGTSGNNLMVACGDFGGEIIRSTRLSNRGQAGRVWSRSESRSPAHAAKGIGSICLGNGLDGSLIDSFVSKLSIKG